VRNHKARLIRRTLRDYHRIRIKEATNSPNGLWKLVKWAWNREPCTTFIPPLQQLDGQMEIDATRKLELFREAFFPPPLEVDLEDIKGYRYLSPVCFPLITLNEVIKLIKYMPGRKVLGKDTIPSYLLHHIASYIAQPL
jgi:hypothetical protein